MKTEILVFSGESMGAAAFAAQQHLNEIGASIRKDVPIQMSATTVVIFGSSISYEITVLYQVA